MSSKWRILPFEEVFEDVSGGNKKVLQSTYLREGAIPVVDQGKNLVGGYTNEQDCICKSLLPVLVFGDHTKCIKYIDFQFAMGADGIKVLKPRFESDTKYLYYYLCSLKLPDAGYDRHFKYLKRIEITLPPLPEQRRIAAILDKGDSLREKRRQAIAKLDELLKSVFVEMFGDPVTNPKGWEIKPLGELLNFRTGKLDSNAAVEGGAYPFFTCSREDFRIDSHAFDCEALLLAGNNATADYSVKYYKGKFNAYQRTYVITLQDSNYSYFYMKYALEKKLLELKRLSKGTNTKYLTLSILKELKIQVPDSALQKRFERNTLKINEILERQEDFLHSTNNLFVSLQQRAFSGELFSEKAPVTPSALEVVQHV